MFRRAWLSAVVAGIAVVLVTPGQALALNYPGARICAEGSVTAGERTAGSPARTPLVVRFQPCAGTDPAVVAGARWAMAEYSDTIAYLRVAPRPFPADGSQGTEVTPGYVDGMLTDAYRRGLIRATCLVTGYETRVACVRVSLDGSGPAGRIQISPLSVGDPLVNRPADYHGMVVEPNPECAACV